MPYGSTLNEVKRLLPSPKRRRLDGTHKIDEIPPELAYCQYLLATTDDQPVPTLPSSLLKYGSTTNNHGKLKKIFDDHGFRTSVVSCPREALSVHKDSCALPTNALDVSDGRTWIVTLLGLHPRQDELERYYSTSIKEVYCLMLFCQRIRELSPLALKNSTTADLISGCELQCRSLGRMKTHDFPSSQIVSHAQALSDSVPRLVATLIRRVVNNEPRHRVEQLEREFERIALWNSTLSNALVSLFLRWHQCHIKEIIYRRTPQLEYERLTIYLYDPHVDYNTPPHFVFMPKVRTILTQGPDALVEEILNLFWLHLLRQGYFATAFIKERLSVGLKDFFLSGITNGRHVPIPLHAHFTPTRPLSYYFFGKAGAGKSSLVRNFQPAIEAAIEATADPEILARFVKQNLNKRFDILELELQLRPNNNDLSVMSIIQGRRMTRTQTKPGLVVVHLEEMPSNDPTSNPNQLQVTQLISQRFSGRHGAFQASDKPPPRNSENRGIANDASLVSVFTSNYPLDDASREALNRLKMFEHLEAMEITAVSGMDRINFANAYLRQCLKDRFLELEPNIDLSLHISVGKGDTRPLVRYLRMIAFYTGALVSRSLRLGGRVEVNVVQEGQKCLIFTATESIELKTGTLNNLFPVVPRVYDTRVNDVIPRLADIFPSLDELSIILDFWLARTFAPAVIVSNDQDKIRKLMEVIKTLKDVYFIDQVNAQTYKMMKSLYDPNDTPNLRDDILRFGRGATVAVELQCPSKDAQLRIREIIEDSPSMTAFSTAQSALGKDGLLFAVYVCGEITPEVRSRASIIF